MELTHENYFSVEANKEYMSVSQFKEFSKCQAKALSLMNGEYSTEEKAAFLEGHLFEAMVSGEEDLFFMQHPEILASRGPTKGEIKANFKDAIAAASKVKMQQFIMDKIKTCDKQVILTGEIEGIKVKCCLDLLDLKNQKIYELKCMKNFNDIWNKENRIYEPWYRSYNYVLQLAVYQEIVRQNYDIICDTHLIAATKESEPDIQCLEFDNELLKVELENFKSNIRLFDGIKKGTTPAERCEHCDFCKMTKKIISFEKIS